MAASWRTCEETVAGAFAATESRFLKPVGDSQDSRIQGLCCDLRVSLMSEMTRRPKLLVLAPAILSAAVLYARQNPPGAAGNPQWRAPPRWPRARGCSARPASRATGPAGQGSDRGPSLASRTLGPRQRGRRPLSLDSQRRARHADAAVPRVERHRSLAAGRLRSQPAGGDRGAGAPRGPTAATPRPAKRCSSGARAARPVTR